MNEIMNNFGGQVANSKINSRIESVDSPELNRKLFSFYECLVKPFKEVEDLYCCVDNCKRGIENNKTEITCVTVGIIKKFIIIALITFGISLFVTFGIYFITGFDITIFLSEECNVSDDIIFPFFFLWAPIGSGIIGVIIYIIVKIRIHKGRISEYETEISLLEKQIEEKLPALCEVSCIIPPNYRFSAALAFFVDAYSNSKVDNLKEAVNLFDTHDYRRQMLDSQHMIMNNLQQIEFNQMMLYDQLDRLNTNIWFSEVLF